MAEKLGVSNRTISRWESGNNMPDFDYLIDLANYYDVGIEEILNGERTAEMMDKKSEETLYKIAEYTNDEKERLMKKLHLFSWIGVGAWVVFIMLNALGLADAGLTEKIASEPFPKK